MHQQAFFQEEKSPASQIISLHQLGKSYREIAKTLNIKKSTVEARLQKAKQKGIYSPVQPSDSLAKKTSDSH